MFALALATFVLLLAWGAAFFGWNGNGLDQAMIIAFVLGTICGFKAKN